MVFIFLVLICNNINMIWMKICNFSILEKWLTMSLTTLALYYRIYNISLIKLLIIFRRNSNFKINVNMFTMKNNFMLYQLFHVETVAIRL